MKPDGPFISLLEFRRISDLLYTRAGLRFSESKMYFLSSRLYKRMESLGIRDTRAYIDILNRNDGRNEEFQELVDLITVNETYFFRDFPQLESFSEGCLSEIVGHKRASGSRTITVWSVGCSSGEEPYTIAIILLEMLEDPGHWDIRIVGSDIDRNVLRKAEQGVYGERSLRDVPSEYLGRYFTRDNGGTYRVTESLRNLVRFEHLNLMDRDQMKLRRNFDFIFCRNVLIYFDDDSRRKVVDHFYLALNRPGFIFLGSSEALGRITGTFSIRRLSNMLVYGKE